MQNTEDGKNDIDVKVDIAMKTEIKADLAPVITATPTGLKYVFNLLLGKKHAAAERMIKLADAQNAVDIKKIMCGDAVYDQESNQLVEIRTVSPKMLIAEKIQEDEVTNLIECSMHAAAHIQDNEDPEFTGASEDFLSRWKSEAKHFSTEEARAIWGRVLAEEVNAPGSISLRTIDSIRNLSKEEASHFNEACKYVLLDNYLVDNQKGTPISTQAFSAIRDAGLIANYTPGMYRGSKWPENNIQLSNGEMAESYWVRSKDFLVFVEKDALQAAGLKPPSFTYWELTMAGRELYKVISSTMELSIEEILSGLAEAGEDVIKMLKYTKYTDVVNKKIDIQSIKGVFDVDAIN